MNRRFLLMSAMTFLKMGCGASQPPIAGGRPTEHWVEALEDKDVAKRIEAIKKLGNIGNKDPEALPAVFNALSDSSPSVRKEAIYAVVRNRSASHEAIPVLEEMKQNDSEPQIRKIAEEAHDNLSDGK